MQTPELGRPYLVPGSEAEGACVEGSPLGPLDQPAAT